MYQTKENGTIQSLPYDKFLQQGAENLTEEELIAIILRTGEERHTQKNAGFLTTIYFTLLYFHRSDYFL